VEHQPTRTDGLDARIMTRPGQHRLIWAQLLCVISRSSSGRWDMITRRAGVVALMCLEGQKRVVDRPRAARATIKTGNASWRPGAIGYPPAHRPLPGRTRRRAPSRPLERFEVFHVEHQPTRESRTDGLDARIMTRPGQHRLIWAQLLCVISRSSSGRWDMITPATEGGCRADVPRWSEACG
jgi:hypothetical protein